MRLGKGSGKLSYVREIEKIGAIDPRKENNNKRQNTSLYDNERSRYDRYGASLLMQKQESVQ